MSMYHQQDSETNFTGSAQDIKSWNDFEKYTCKITSTFPKGWLDKVEITVDLSSDAPFMV